MGPMGPMMGGGPWQSGPADWSWVLLPLLVILVLGLTTLVRGYSRPRAERGGPHAPEHLLRDRYARGELTGVQYREALVDILKDRYVRGEIELDDYETRLGSLLEAERPRSEGAPVPRIRKDTGGRAPEPSGPTETQRLAADRRRRRSGC